MPCARCPPCNADLCTADLGSADLGSAEEFRLRIRRSQPAGSRADRPAPSPERHQGGEYQQRQRSKPAEQGDPVSGIRRVRQRHEPAGPGWQQPRLLPAVEPDRLEHPPVEARLPAGVVVLPHHKVGALASGHPDEPAGVTPRHGGDRRGSSTGGTLQACVALRVNQGALHVEPPRVGCGLDHRVAPRPDSDGRARGKLQGPALEQVGHGPGSPGCDRLAIDRDRGALAAREGDPSGPGRRERSDAGDVNLRDLHRQLRRRERQGQFVSAKRFERQLPRRADNAPAQLAARAGNKDLQRD